MTPFSKLTQTAQIGSNQINVTSAAGWKVGSKIVISPSYSNYKEYEEVTITAINMNLVSFIPSLMYEHYGAPSATISNSFGSLDTRSTVGLLTRNIKILASNNSDNWGGRVQIYGYQ